MKFDMDTPEDKKRYSEYIYPSKVSSFVKQQIQQPVVALFVKRGKVQKVVKGKIVETHVGTIKRVVIG